MEFAVCASGVAAGMLLKAALGAVVRTDPLLRRLNGRLPAGFAPVFDRHGALLPALIGGLAVWLYDAVAGHDYWYNMAFVLTLTAIAVIDYDYKIVLDKLLAVLALLEIGYWSYAPGAAWSDGLWGAAAGGGIMAAIALLSSGGLGWGDVKLTAVLGIGLGRLNILLTVWLAFVGGGFAAMALIARGRSRRSTVPFAPFIAAAALLSRIYGEAIWSWYMMNYL